MKPQQARQFAVMSVERGETIAGIWVAPPITDIGTYKLVAKQKPDGNCEWAHFVQRADGRRDKVYRGTVECPEHLEDVLTAINAALRRTFGPAVQLQPADADFFALDGRKLDSSVQLADAAPKHRLKQGDESGSV
jgi:hypothetical protein